MRARRRFGMSMVAALAAGALFAGSSTLLAEPAFAESPVQFESGNVLDEAGVLGPDTASIEKSIDDLYSSTGIDLFVVYVKTFTDPTDASDWADTTADLNNMGTDDYLLAIATEGRAYHLSAAPDSPLSEDQLVAVERSVEVPLHDNDWAGAALAATGGLSDAADGGGVEDPDSGTTNGTMDGTSNSGSTSNGSGFFWFLIIAIVIVGLVIFFVARRKGARKPITAGQSQAGPKDELAGLSLKELQRRSGSALVATDDAVRTSEQELGFAIAQYGKDATVDFQAALTTAKTQLTEAFTLQQRLDDVEPDTEQEQRDWLGQIIRLCEQANDELDDQADAFNELRALEKNAPDAMASVEKDVVALEPRLAKADATLTALAAKYSPSALSPVLENVSQARERLAFATTARAAAGEKLAAGETGPAAVAIRAAEGAVQQTTVLLDAIDRLQSDLDTSRPSIAAAVADLEGDIAQAQALAGAGTTGLDGVIASTRQTVADAKAALAATRLDPPTITARLETANTQIDSILQGVRDAQQQAERTRSALGHTLLTAHSQVSAAQDYIAARRGAVGAEARTRLAEAARLAQQAESQQSVDPAAALATAQRSSSLASQAIQLAQNDLGGFQAAGDGGWGELFGGGGHYPSGRGGSGGMGSLITGAIIGGLLSGGGRSRGGFGGLGGGFGGARRGGGGSFGGGFSGGGGRRGGGGRF